MNRPAQPYQLLFPVRHQTRDPNFATQIFQTSQVTLMPSIRSAELTSSYTAAAAQLRIISVRGDAGCEESDGARCSASNPTIHITAPAYLPSDLLSD